MDRLLPLAVMVSVYLVVVCWLGYLGYRHTRTAEDYLLAGRGMNPFFMALSYGATFISTSAIVGFGGVAAIYGMGILWLTFLNIFVGIFIAFVFFGARTRAMGHSLGAHTFPEFLGKRYQSKGLHLGAAMLILLFMPLYAGVVLMGAAKFIEVRLGIGYESALLIFSAIVAAYVIFGGLKGVIYTDALQGALMMAGLLAILFFTYRGLGGFIPAHEKLTAMAPVAVETFGVDGHRGWTAMPAFGSKMWWTLVSTIIAGVGIGVLAQPQLVVRFMTVKSKKQLNRAVIAGGIFILVATAVAYLAGPLSNVYFYNDPRFAKVAFLVANKDVENIIPLFIKTYMPAWLGDLFMVTLLAAAMSTASGLFHAMGTAAGRDIVESFSSRSSDRFTIAANRGGILATFLFSVVLAYVLPVTFAGTGTAIIARGTSIFFGLCASTFLPMYIGALYSRSITRAGVIAGGLVGFGLSAFWIAFIQITSAKVLLICQAISGKPSLVEGLRTGPVLWQEVDPVFVALPLSILVTVIVSLFTSRYGNDHLSRCFSWQRPASAVPYGGQKPAEVSRA